MGVAKTKNGKKVLVVDDDPLARDIYRNLLEADGFEVVDAPDGKSGLAAFRGARFDCVILDIYMPGLSGLDVMEELDPDTNTVPIIAVSGAGANTGSHPLELAGTLGAARSFDKGFGHEELMKAVRELTGVG
jgi:DNA-binding response OmpR family regulator